MTEERLSVEDELRADRVGVWSEARTFEVEAERTIAYAQATNDPIPEHLDGAFAPPVFAVVPPFSALAEATLAVVPEQLQMKILHGEQEFRFHRPITPGETLTSRAKVVGIHGKAAGVVVTTVAETRGASGDLVNEQYFTAFFRGGLWPHEVGSSAPAHAFDESLRSRAPEFVVSQRFDEDQTFRYAGPSGDSMPIHLDDAVAQRFGLPGIIIHGLCTMAFESHAVLGALAPIDPRRLKRLAVRFASPARPGQTMITSIWQTASDVAMNTYAFESIDDDGTTLIKDGLAEIASA